MFRVTQDLYFGRFASHQRLAELQALRVTDIVNVSDTQSLLTKDEGPFRSVNWFEIQDRTLIPATVVIEALDTIHSALSAESGRVYIHCMAGWNRSPTILWLYLLACGIDRDLATHAICSAAIDAVPGHKLLIDSQLLKSVTDHGRSNYTPHPRPDAIQLIVET